MTRGLRTSLVVLGLAVPSASLAHEFRAGEIFINHPALHARSEGARTGVGYVTITNFGKSPDRLVGGSTVASERFELHRTEVVDGLSRMRMAEDGVAIIPGETVDLKSGGTHIMLVGLKNPLLPDQSFAGELVFEKAGAVAVDFIVEPFMGMLPTFDDHVP